MPIYEYKCRKCNTIFEAIQSFGASSPTRCDACGASSQYLTRLISTSQIVFKGSGFYLTDNRQAKNSALDTSPVTKTASEPVAVTAEKPVVAETKPVEATKQEKSE